MGVFDFMKKKEEKPEFSSLKDPFQTPSGEPVVEEVGKSFTKESITPPSIPKDPFDLVDSPPFKPRSDSSKELDEVINSLRSVSTQLRAMADKLNEVKDKMRQ